MVRSTGRSNGSNEERDERMAMTDERATERAAERATAERGKAVDAALQSIEKQFGRGAIMKLGSSERQASTTMRPFSSRASSGGCTSSR